MTRKVKLPKLFRSKKKPKGENLEDFFSEIEDLEAEIAKLKELVTETVQFLSSILTVGNDSTIRAKLDEKHIEVKKQSAKVKDRLREFNDKNNELEKSEKISGTTLHIRKTQHKFHMDKFMALITEYHDSQLDFKDKSRTRIVRGLKAAGESNIDDDSVEEMLQSHDPNVFSHMLIADSKHAKEVLQDVVNRQEEIYKTEQQITEIQDLFLALADHVARGGEKIDTIESNVNKALLDVEQGQKQAADASKKASQMRKCKIIMFIVLAVVIVIVIIVLATTM